MREIFRNTRAAVPSIVLFVRASDLPPFTSPSADLRCRTSFAHSPPFAYHPTESRSAEKALSLLHEMDSVHERASVTVVAAMNIVSASFHQERESDCDGQRLRRAANVIGLDAHAPREPQRILLVVYANSHMVIVKLIY